MDIKLYKTLLNYKYYILILLSIVLYTYYYLNIPYEGFQVKTINKTIWILWLQGWDSAPWLSRQVVKSWKVKNPDWNVVLLTYDNIKDYVDDIDYVYRDTISPQAKSDIIRLSLLKKYGGVWADATLLCMEPLDSWIDNAIQPSGIWMYRGRGGGDLTNGPACWFIISIAGNSIITKWKNACDYYWRERQTAEIYYWVDGIFKMLCEIDAEFKREWERVPYLHCDDRYQAHMFTNGSWKQNTLEVKEILYKSPPHVLKLWNKQWSNQFPNVNSERCKQSNGYYAIQLAISEKS